MPAATTEIESKAKCFREAIQNRKSIIRAQKIDSSAAHEKRFTTEIIAQHKALNHTSSFTSRYQRTRQM